MTDTWIIDAHTHVGAPGPFFCPESEPDHLLARMDRLGVAAAVCCDHVSVYDGCAGGLDGHRRMYERSGGRIHYLGVFDPRRAAACLAALDEAKDWAGLVGLKIHPSIHGTPAEDPAYELAWRFAADHDLAILAHTWSVSDYNPVQQLSTPGRFEPYVQRFPQVRFVLGHAGGRGAGRHEAARMANEHPNVYLDFAGDIFCHRLIETLTRSVPPEKILFGSDFPWLDPRANLTRVLLADVDVSAKAKILHDNAVGVYRIGACAC